MNILKHDSAYPILDGNAVVKVSLKNETSKLSWVESLINRLKRFMVNGSLRSYFQEESLDLIPLVKLNSGMRVEDLSVPRLELDLMQDSIPVFHQVKLALGGFVAAGFIMLAAWGLTGNSGMDKVESTANRALEGQISRMTNTDKRGETSVIMVKSGNEEMLMSSLIQPGDNHPFQKLGHTNMAPSSHVNNAGAINHTNTDAYSDFIPHTNITHSNEVNPHTNNGHNNGGHNNSYSDTP